MGIRVEGIFYPGRGINLEATEIGEEGKNRRVKEKGKTKISVTLWLKKGGGGLMLL